MNRRPGQALAAGPLGVALLHIERGDLDLARRALAEAVAGGVSAGANACLFHGAPAVEFVLGRAGHVDLKVQAAVDVIVARRLAAACERRASGERPMLAEFDLIRGLTGLGVVLLSRGANTALLGEILTYLVGLAKPVRVDGMTLPGWWTETGPGGEELVGGHGNNGMAHGIAGPLALLAIARRHGAEVSSQEGAIEAFARWLERFDGAYWITYNQMSRSELPAAGPARPSWCYGALGIARARQLAALALGDTDRRQQAENLAYAALTAPEVSHLTIDACLCHGWAGLLTVTKAIASDSPGPDRFHGPINTLTKQVTTGLDALPESGLMEGRTGAELALLNSQAVGWTRALLID